MHYLLLVLMLFKLMSCSFDGTFWYLYWSRGSRLPYLVGLSRVTFALTEGGKGVALIDHLFGRPFTSVFHVCERISNYSIKSSGEICESSRHHFAAIFLCVVSFFLYKHRFLLVNLFGHLFLSISKCMLSTPSFINL